MRNKIKNKVSKEDKILNKLKYKNSNKQTKYNIRQKMKIKIKNAQDVTNIKEVNEDGIIHLKTGEVACLYEVDAIDLSLSSNNEKSVFFNMLKSLYQIKNLNLKCYKLDEKLNLNANKIYLDDLKDKFKEDKKRLMLLEESRGLIDELEEKEYTISSKYFWVVIAKDQIELKKQIEELEDIVYNIVPKINIELIKNRLLIYKFLCNLYLSNDSLDTLLWIDLSDLVSLLNITD